jgi:hypothetical protein
MIRCRVYFKLSTMVISSLNDKKCAISNKKCKSLSFKALYGEAIGEIANEYYLRTLPYIRILSYFRISPLFCFSNLVRLILIITSPRRQYAGSRRRRVYWR